jgi:hypothetical protein
MMTEEAQSAATNPRPILPALSTNSNLLDPSDSVQLLKDDLSRWRSAMRPFTHRHAQLALTRPPTEEAEGLAISMRGFLLLEVTARLWIYSILSIRPPSSLFHEALLLAKETLEGFKKAIFRPKYW